MFRLRRYRVFIAVAALCLVALYHYGTWIDDKLTNTDSTLVNLGGRPKASDAAAPGDTAIKQEPVLEEGAKQNPLGSYDHPKLASTVANEPAHTYTGLPKVGSPTPSGHVQDATIPKVSLPDRKPGKAAQEEINPKEEPLHAGAPSSGQDKAHKAEKVKQIHWEKLDEHFPVRTESIIQLPTGTPEQLPKIQHTFGEEEIDAKEVRVERQRAVKNQFLKAWKGYKKYAWKHDELTPVSGSFKDPFCGWAATLVDALDTLWIMDLHEEFEEAVEAVKTLDFTTSQTVDIPLFETVIRYLGGLLAAYDVSGSKYPILLKKAVELGDILMGAFDTPNRMPLTYYRWKPAYVSQPHRADVRVNLAQLGSMSMEFTRLAQLTYEPRYYDAVARITNALSEWQDRGTTLDGVFPEMVDCSGCDKMATKAAAMPKSKQGESSDALLGDGDPMGYGDEKQGQSVEGEKDEHSGEPLRYNIIPGDMPKAEIVEEKPTPATLQSRDVPLEEPLPMPSRSYGHARLISDQPVLEDPEDKELYKGTCIPQGLGPGVGTEYNQAFSMAGSQDSTYEYFPKVRSFS